MPTLAARFTVLHARVDQGSRAGGPSAWGLVLARTAYARGLAVTRPDGSTVPIPISATPVVLDDETASARAALAGTLSSAGLKLARHALADDALRARVLAALSPLEAALASAQGGALDMLATARVDFLADAHGALHALELNTTIPAMQGYSDIAADAFLEVAGAHAGVDAATVARWRREAPSNARALHAALLAGFERARPGARPARIGILCRRGDAQLTELVFLRDRFRAFGSDARIVHPDQLVLTADAVRVDGDPDGQPVDLIYRHLFVRRLEEPGMIGADAVRALLADPQQRRAVVLNAPSSHAELKSVFAWMSRAGEDDALARAAGLDDAERAAVQRAVPWTRTLEDEAVRARVAGDPDAFVLKRAWDYGGRAVLVGRAREDEDFRARVHAAWPDIDPRADWGAIVTRAAADPRGGGFIAQRHVEAVQHVHVLCTPDDVRSAALTVDYSAYASVGLHVDVPWHGVCRGAPGSVVNIMGGGGVVPLVRPEVARALGLA